jgi:hypothetical protein
MDALSAHLEHKMIFMPPQFYILSTLADILNGSKTTTEQIEQVKKLSQGGFGRLTINPRGIGKSSDGRTILAYEGDEARGGVKGRMHRALVQFEKAVRLSFLLASGSEDLILLQTPSQITLVRNFDIFEDIDRTTFGGTPTSKL